jgi:DNA-binding CsgD family transcriptional regulator
MHHTSTATPGNGGMGGEFFGPDPIGVRARIVAEVAELLATGDGALDTMLDTAAEIIGRSLADTCIIGVLYRVDSVIYPLGLYDQDAERRRHLDSLSDLAWEVAGDASGQAMGMGEPAVFTSVELGVMARDQPLPMAFLEGTNVDTAMVAPLRALGVQVGLMVLARTSPHPPFDPGDLPFVQRLADRLGLAVHALHLQDELDALRVKEAGTDPEDQRLAMLSQREREIFKSIAQGLTSREIGNGLFLSVRTVEWHRARLMAKLGTSKRSELIALGRTLRP